MKISPNSAVAFAFVACAMIVTSCANDVETDMNVDPAGNAISFVPSVGGTTRATETTIKNLGDFAVIARGMHHDGGLYDNFLIGGKTGGEIAEFSSLTSDGTAGTWKLKRDVQWPSSLEKVLFIGYTVLKRNDKNESEDSKQGVLGDATFSVSAKDQPTISNFQPLRNGLNDNVAGVWADGRSQKDLLVAFQQEKRGIQTTVNLNFRHALTQVSIRAGQKEQEDTDHRIVKVKGAWIVNAAQSGTLTADISVNPSTKEASNKTSWTASAEKVTYGSYYNDVVSLVKNGNAELLRHSLMLTPQNLKEWDGKTTETTDAYIMLLCRVELVHSGAGHDGLDIEDIGVVGEGETGTHYHQLFPVNAQKYDGSEYGFVCVPVSTDWADVEEEGDEDCKGMGKHYTYLLDICGRNSGAGIYPPIAADAARKLIPTGATVTTLVYNPDIKKYEEKEDVPLTVVTDIPEGKKVGDPVLDDPIKFTVSVRKWDTEDVDWTNGTANPSDDKN